MRRGVVLAGFALLAVGLTCAQAASPFGVGLPEQGAPMSGFGGFFAYVAARQSEFYRALTAALKALRSDDGAIWWLAGLSFAYGVFHAAGPGHGKAVISSYALASGETVRRAVVLSFAAALAQAVTAVALVGVAAVVLNMTSIAITRTTEIFEIGSYALVAGLGAVMLWRKARALRRLAPEAAGHHHHDHPHADHEPCAGCGHSHAPDPAQLAGPLTLARAGSVVLAVGLRPCTGALIVLIFALSQGLIAAGVLSAFVMALGTGLTVAVLAGLAVGARGLATRLAGPQSRLAAGIHHGVELVGAALVLLLGLVLLTAALGWG